MAYPLLDLNVGDKIIANHRVMDVRDPEAADLLKPSRETKYYEVVRCMAGVPLFLEDHLDRLEASTANRVRWNREVLIMELRELIAENRMMDGNVKIVMTGTMQLLYANSFYYPTKEEYLTGVRVGLLRWHRADPNVKVVREDYKKAINGKLTQQGVFGTYFETLLVDTDGFITEGSRSNVFFVKGTQVFTAPDADILKGITRKYVLKAIEKAGAELVAKKLPAQGLASFIRNGGSAFLSGTSIGVLPICAIEEYRIETPQDAMTVQIMKEYDNIIQNYLKLHK